MKEREHIKTETIIYIKNYKEKNEEKLEKLRGNIYPIDVEDLKKWIRKIKP